MTLARASEEQRGARDPWCAASLCKKNFLATRHRLHHLMYRCSSPMSAAQRASMRHVGHRVHRAFHQTSSRCPPCPLVLTSFRGLTRLRYGVALRGYVVGLFCRSRDARPDPGLCCERPADDVCCVSRDRASLWCEVTMRVMTKSRSDIEADPPLGCGGKSEHTVGRRG